MKQRSNESCFGCRPVDVAPILVVLFVLSHYLSPFLLLSFVLFLFSSLRRWRESTSTWRPCSGLRSMEDPFRKTCTTSKTTFATAKLTSAEDIPNAARTAVAG